MVEVPNRPPTPAGPRPSGPPTPREVCPSLMLEVDIGAGVSLREGDPISAQVLGGRVRLLFRGQVVAWVDDETTVRTIKRCQESGGRYEGQVGADATGVAVILLERRG